MTRKPAVPPDGTIEATRERLRRALAGGGDDTNPEFLYSDTHTALLLAIEDGLIDTARLARRELANRGLDAVGVWCGFPKAREIHLTEQGDAAEAPTAPVEQAVADIAQRLLHLDTIATRNSDALDFHELAVWSVRDALMAAYTAGAQAAGNGHTTRQEG